jgi:Na+-transporting NADH:ubiquinone oxidoreductase subunit NqrF
MTNKSSYDGKEMVRSDFFHYEAFPNDTNCPVPAVSSSLMASNAPADKQLMFHPKGESFVKHTNARLCRLLPTGRKNFDGGRFLPEVN